METNQGLLPAIGDLVPYNIKTCQLVEFKNTPEDLAAYKQLVTTKHIDFLAINGQHSTEAAKQLVQDVENDAKLKDCAERVRFRTLRILSSHMHIDILPKRSHRGNKMNATTKFKSLFLDTISHARKQYSILGNPPKPRTGDTSLVDPKYWVNLF